MVKNYILAISAFVLVISCQNMTKNPETTEQITEEVEPGIYGEKISGENPVPAQDLVNTLTENDSVWVTFKSRIAANCKHSGCWMDLDLGNEEVIKVTFKDYAFFIPLDSEGKTATIEGYAKKEWISVDLLRHYAEDDGKSPEEIEAITEPELAYTFEAIGVIIEE